MYILIKGVNSKHLSDTSTPSSLFSTTLSPPDKPTTTFASTMFIKHYLLTTTEATSDTTASVVNGTEKIEKVKRYLRSIDND